MTQYKTGWFSFLHPSCKKHLALSYPSVNAEWEDWEMNYDIICFTLWKGMNLLGVFLVHPCFWQPFAFDCSCGDCQQRDFCEYIFNYSRLSEELPSVKQINILNSPTWIPAVCLSFSRAFATVFCSAVIDEVVRHRLGKWVWEVSELKRLWLTAKPAWRAVAGDVPWG